MIQFIKFDSSRLGYHLDLLLIAEQIVLSSASMLGTAGEDVWRVGMMAAKNAGQPLMECLIEDSNLEDSEGFIPDAWTFFFEDPGYEEKIVRLAVSIGFKPCNYPDDGDDYACTMQEMVIRDAMHTLHNSREFFCPIYWVEEEVTEALKGRGYPACFENLQLVRDKLEEVIDPVELMESGLQVAIGRLEDDGTLAA